MKKDHLVQSIKSKKDGKYQETIKQVPHLTKGTTWDSNKKQLTLPTRAKRSALSQQVTIRKQ